MPIRIPPLGHYVPAVGMTKVAELSTALQYLLHSLSVGGGDTDYTTEGEALTFNETIIALKA